MDKTDGSDNDLDDIQSLILRLYTTTDSSERSLVDRTLISLQKSDEGFKLADELLKSEYEEARFYGATTFIVKINQSLRKLEDEDARRELLNRLLYWLVYATEHKYKSLTTKKLCSCLVAYFIQSKGEWENCVGHVFACLLQNQVVDEPSMDSLDPVSGVERMGSLQLSSLLTFISTLVAEADKFGSTPGANYDPAIKESLPFQLAIISTCLQSPNVSQDPKVDAMTCYKELIDWAKNGHTQEFPQLRALFPALLAQLDNADLADAVLESLWDMLSEPSSFMNKEMYDHVGSLIATPKFDEWIRAICDGQIDHAPFSSIKVLYAYAEACATQLISSDSELAKLVLNQCLRIVKCKDSMEDEELVLSSALDFWSHFVESMVDIAVDEGGYGSENSLEQNRWTQWNDGMLINVTLAFLYKIRLPIGVESAPESQKALTELRMDYRDFLSSLFTILGMPIVSIFSQHLWVSWEQSDWAGIEAGLCSLNGFSDDISELPFTDSLLRSLFQSDGGASKLELLCNAPNTPEDCKKTAILFISRYSPVLLRNYEWIPSMMRSLISCIQIPTLASRASSSIQSLCSTARAHLTNSVPDLLALFESYITLPSRDFQVQEKLARALGAVIQALSTAPSQAGDYSDNNAPELLDRLLQLIQSDMEEGVSTREQNFELARNRIICDLKCLQGIGKGLQAPDQVVDLDEPTEALPNVWQVRSEQCAALQAKILGMSSNAFSIFNRGEEVETLCKILRCGYTESEAGPFVFPINATENFVLQCNLTTPQIGQVFEAVEMVLNKNRSFQSGDVKNFALNVMLHFRGMIPGFFQSDPSNEPEVASLVIDFLKSFIPKHYDALLNAGSNVEELYHTIDFTLICLGSHEIMPKRSSAQFWTAFIGNMDKTPSKELVEACTSRYSAKLITILVRQIGGGAARSELDDISEPLRKLVFKGGVYTQYIKQAMHDLPTEPGRVSEADKRIAAEKILSLRGKQETRDVVKEFWAACRGSFVIR